MLHTCPTKNVSNFLVYIYLTIFFVLNNSVKFVISKISKIDDGPSFPPLNPKKDVCLPFNFIKLEFISSFNTFLSTNLVMYVVGNLYYYLLLL